MTREENLEKLFHTFAYLKMNYNSRIVFDTIHPDIDLLSRNAIGRILT